MAFNTNVNDLLTDAQSTYRNQLSETKQYVSKWEGTGLLEGIGADYEKHNTAILLENQARQLISEASVTNAGTGNDKENWAGVALPLVRRVFAEIAAKEFVSVQPMNLPSGLIFYLDFKYGNDVLGGATTGTFADGTDVMGNTSSSGDATGGLYGAGKFGYSINNAESASLDATVTSASWKDVGYDSALSASVDGSTNDDIKKVTVTLAGGDHDPEGVQGFRVTADGGGKLTLGTHYPQFTTVDGNNVSFFILGGNGMGNITGGLTVQYAKQPVANARGDFEDTTPAEFGTSANSAGANIGIPEIEVELKQVPIVAKTRKMKVVWSPEFQQDLNAYHSIDAEAELTSMLSEYISMEIDLEILAMLSQNANTVEYWSARIGDTYNGGTAGTEADFTSVDAPAAYNQGTWFQTLGTKIAKVSNKIHQKTMRGGANFLVTSPEICTILESIPGYGTDSSGEQNQFAMGVSKVGAINNKYTVYKNPYMTSNEIILGFRGAQFLETGAVYAPYIPLIMTPLVYAPTNFTPRKGVMTRYAKKVVRPEFFGKVFCSDLHMV